MCLTDGCISRWQRVIITLIFIPNCIVKENERGNAVDKDIGKFYYFLKASVMMMG